MLSRNGKDWTATFAGHRAHASRGCRSTPHGSTAKSSSWTPTGARASRRCRTCSTARMPRSCTTSSSTCCTSIGHDLRQVPLVERKKLLERLLEGAPATLRFSAHVEGRAKSSSGRRASSSSKASSPSGRSRSIVGGRSARLAQGEVQPAPGDGDRRLHRSAGHPQGLRRAAPRRLRERWHAPLLGQSRHRIRRGDACDVHKQLKALETKEPAFRNPPRGYEAKGAHWIRPELVAEIEFTEWTNDGTLRHPSFQGLRRTRIRRTSCASAPVETEKSPRARRHGEQEETRDRKIRDGRETRAADASVEFRRRHRCACQAIVEGREERRPRNHRSRTPARWRASSSPIRTRSSTRKRASPNASSPNTTNTSPSGSCRICATGRSRWFDARTAGRSHASIRSIPMPTPMPPSNA